jgi:hypothetical protein
MLKQNKPITIIAFLLLFLSLIITFMPTNVYAVTCELCYQEGHQISNHKCEICGNTHDLSDDKVSSLQRTFYEINNLVYAAQMFDKTNGTGLTTLDALTFDTTKGEFALLWARAGAFYDTFRILGIMLAVIYSLTETLAHLDKDKLTGEHFIREIFKMSIAAIFIMNGFDFVTGLVGVGSELIKQTGTAQLNSTFNAANCVYGLFTSTSLLEAIMEAFEVIGRIVAMFLPWLTLTIAKVVIAVACWARVLELMVRIIFSPIGLADMFVYGTRSNGVRYMKKILVCAIQGAVTMAMVQAYGIVISSVNFGEGLWMTSVILAVVMLMSATKAKDIASDVIGV